ncbi:bleomycin resistance protein [Xanthomonas vesicatoria]|uniref:Bleomycin resistance protein n=1 Tax=Xanthomonas vesicatoria ATCC 35937 TaxID=925775 RepID=F0BFL8_9XANT|nr:hypothetical protein XVE_3032 [Xanthomonas vesicatoria ATCC 35937]
MFVLWDTSLREASVGAKKFIQAEPASHVGISGVGQQGESVVTQTVIPVLRVTDATSSFPFYTQGLGFTIDFEYRHEPGFPVFAQLTREGQSIFLTEHADDCQVGGAIHFMVPDVDACYSAFKAAGLAQTPPPFNTAWKTREIQVVDPDGNRLTFSTELAA